jgi:hypothetical protein
VNDLLEMLAPHERRAVEVVAAALVQHNPGDGDGLLTGPRRYAVLQERVRLAGTQARTVREFWDRLARHMLWRVPPRSSHPQLLALLSPRPGDEAVVATLATGPDSVVMLAAEAYRERRPKAPAKEEDDGQDL